MKLAQYNVQATALTWFIGVIAAMLGEWGLFAACCLSVYVVVNVDDEIKDKKNE